MTPVDVAALPVQPTDLRPLRHRQAGALLFAPRTHDADGTTVQLRTAAPDWPWWTWAACAVLVLLFLLAVSR